MKKLLVALWLCSTALYAQQTTPLANEEPTQAPLKIGEELPVQIQTTQPYNQAGQQGIVFEQEFYNKNSSYIKLYFEDFDLNPGDYIEISTENTGESILYAEKGKIIDQQGTMISNFWSQILMDEKVTVRLHAASGSNHHRGFKISRVAYGFSEAKINTLVSGKSICGADNKQRIACYGGQIFNKSKAVCRLVINGSSLCTGWLLGSQGHIMTNNHCIGNASDAANTDYQFNYQYTNCTGGGGSYTNYSGASFVKTSGFYDYTLVRLANNPTSTFGYLQLSRSAARRGRRIYIPQHPGGRPKEVSVNTDIGGVNGKSAIDQVTTNGLRYYADTEGGSSGSPVIDYFNHRVLAIHNTGGCTNGSSGRSDRLISSIGNSMPANGIAPNSVAGGQTSQGVNTSVDADRQRAENLDLDGAPFLSIAPNPVADVLNITTNRSDLEHYRITNVQGQVIKEGQLTRNFIQLGELNKGVYFITFYNEQEQVVRKLMKQ
ncbi:MAG: trypsin-like peptidase domain-containing protein [Aureispira sp.]